MTSDDSDVGSVEEVWRRGGAATLADEGEITEDEDEDPGPQDISLDESLVRMEGDCTGITRFFRWATLGPCQLIDFESLEHGQ